VALIVDTNALSAWLDGELQIRPELVREDAQDGGTSVRRIDLRWSAV
jgi:hypothetical protein